MSFRTAFIIFNAVALVGVVLYIFFRVVSLRRNPEVRLPPNLAEPLDDEALEGPKLDRALAWSLLFVVVFAVSMPLYFLVEPSRQARAEDTFREQSEERGAVLFANSESDAYDATVSLLCANCHGVNGEGGSTTFVLQPEDDKCLLEQNKGDADVPECLPREVVWQAPALDTVLLRFNRGQATEIITYGRPGTPMPAWGVKSGKGVLNEQGIDDLVNYLASIQLTTDASRDRSAQDARDYVRQAAEAVVTQQAELTAAQTRLAEAQAGLAAAESEGDADEIAAQTRAVEVAEGRVAIADAALVATQANADEVASLSEGALLFRLNCARCHTKNWSFYDPAALDEPKPAPQGSGAYGPNLRDGSTLLQFPNDAGRQEQFDWVAIGVPKNEGYGKRGISTGRMPHFARILTEEQIQAIVDYERSL